MKTKQTTLFKDSEIALDESVKELKAHEKFAKSLYIKMIQNKEYDLKDRWDLFIKHGERFGERELFIEDTKIHKFKFFKIDDYSRYQTVDVESLIEDAEEELEYDTDCFWTEEDIDRAKEHILSKNLYSFEIDW